jgi:hypothetical protein
VCCARPLSTASRKARPLAMPGHVPYAGVEEAGRLLGRAAWCDWQILPRGTSVRRLPYCVGRECRCCCAAAPEGPSSPVPSTAASDGQAGQSGRLGPRAAALLCRRADRFGGVLTGGQAADVIDHDQVAAADPGHDLGDRGVDAGSADGGGQGLQGELGAWVSNTPLGVLGADG